MDSWRGTRWERARIRCGATWSGPRSTPWLSWCWRCWPSTARRAGASAERRRPAPLVPVGQLGDRLARRFGPAAARVADRDHAERVHVLGDGQHRLDLLL